MENKNNLEDNNILYEILNKENKIKYIDEKIAELSDNCKMSNKQLLFSLSLILAFLASFTVVLLPIFPLLVNSNTILLALTILLPCTELCVGGIGAIIINYIQKLKDKSASCNLIKILKEDKNEIKQQMEILKNKESVTIKNIIESKKNELIDLRNTLLLYKEYVDNKGKYDKLQKKGKLRYKLQKNHDDYEMDIIEGLSIKNNQKVKRI